MKKLILFIIICSITGILLSQNFEDLRYGTDSTFEVVSWNVENFPKESNVTVDYVTEIIQSIDVDVLAIQELYDTVLFNQMILELESYNTYYESSWFAGLAFIYNPNVVIIDDIYEIYTDYSYWDEFPRSPMVMELTYKDEKIVVINNHLKCCGDGILDLTDNYDEETRRFHACILLKSYIDVYFANDKVIVLGDFNDELTDNQNNNVFKVILEDQENYLFADMEIANGDSNDWSYPSWPSHLDHILITDNLSSDFADSTSSIDVIKIDECMTGGWNDYEYYISDHRPVAIKLKVTKNSDIAGSKFQNPSFVNYPNPFSNKTTFYYNKLVNSVQLIIYDVFGKKVLSQKIFKGENTFEWDTESLPLGFYFAVIYQNNQVVSSIKLVKN